MRLVLALLACCAYCLAGCAQASAPSGGITELGLTTYSAAERVAAPAIAGQDLSGSPVDVGMLRGVPVVVNAWASWCEPCKQETPELVALSRQFPRVRFIGLNVQDRSGKALGFAKKYGMDYPSVVDADAKILGSIPGVPPQALPSTVVIDARGRIAGRVIGEVKPGALDALLTQLDREGSAR